MRIRLTDAEIKHLQTFIDHCEDAERLTAREVVLDLYEISTPVSINFVFVNNGIGVDGAAELIFNEEADGYCMGERIEDSARIRELLEEGGALPPKSNRDSSAEET